MHKYMLLVWYSLMYREYQVSFLMFQILDGTFASQVSHEVDGLIFQPVPDVGLWKHPFYIIAEIQYLSPCLVCIINDI